MKHFATALILAGTTSLGMTIDQKPGLTQPVEACATAGGLIPVEAEYVSEAEPAYVHGNELGSPVNVRSGPGLAFDVIDTSSVGYYVEVVGQAFSRDCETWVQVRFPLSRMEGWIHSHHIMLSQSRDWWD
ncbi:SH3 domain-containing protein [Oscillatoria sp. CS-180]|uniref:SH3 domain-containing protein n=1 Tax=Oscillatoria sp. CS-180 TaxID=3021720 RepID=UPI00232FAB6E|nr:SH3 domain-containing protein [Oscillatoria sp. CS-180]MDB9525731.1 SH3 domain-containing protein [Oscillatoria sp. CS-180]